MKREEKKTPKAAPPNKQSICDHYSKKNHKAKARRHQKKQERVHRNLEGLWRKFIEIHIFL